jgi:hypothetical protein
MAHCSPRFKSKKALKTAVANGERVEVFQDGPFGGPIVNGRAGLEMPPEYHRWYAQVIVKEGLIVKVT